MLLTQVMSGQFKAKPANDFERMVRGERYVPSEPTDPLLDQLQRLIEQEVKRRVDACLTDKINEAVAEAMAPMRRDHAAILDIYDRLKHVERRSTGPSTEWDGQSIHKIAELPSVDQITQLQAQFFDNRANGKKPTYQIKFYVWTCPPSQWADWKEGNCTSLFAPMFDPADENPTRRRKARLNLKNMGITDYDQQVQFMGCVTVRAKKDHGRKLYQRASIFHDKYLLLQIDGQDIGCDPEPASEGYADNARVTNWTWRKPE